mmetsp:Transcript_138977/g.245591  ORF Transcript_138977/g.245591 Transcript_138977/m.245591 type:complete len:743 (-) Transcript_138977:35-2263(-)
MGLWKNVSPAAAPAAAASSSAAGPAVLAADADAKPSMKQSGVQNLFAAGGNQLSRAARSFSDQEMLARHAVACCVLQPIAEWHSTQAKTLRSLEESRVWEAKMCLGHCHHVSRLMVSLLRTTNKFGWFGIEVCWPEQQQASLLEPAIVVSDERAQLLWHTVTIALAEVESRKLQYLYHPRRRLTLVIDQPQAVVEAYVAEVRKDWTIHKELLDLRETNQWAVDVSSSSVYETRPCQQVALLLESQDFVATVRFVEFADEVQARFLAQHPVEQTFNVVKATAAKGANTRITPARVTASALDHKVMSGLNRYEEVQLSDQKLERGGTLDEHFNQPPMMKHKVPKALVDLKVNEIVGSDSTSWYSTSAQFMHKPLATMAALRALHDQGELAAVQQVWLGIMVAHGRFLIRKKAGDQRWFLAVGCIHETLVLCVPVELYRDRFYKIVSSSEMVPAHEIICDERLWEAWEVEAVSPKHLTLEWAAGGSLFPDERRSLPASSHADKVPICVKTIGERRSLLEVACMCAFPEVQVGFLLKLAAHLKIETTANTMFALLKELITNILPAPMQTSAMLRSIFMRKACELEPHDELDEMLTIKYVLDVFDDADKTDLEREFANGKKYRSAWQAYNKEFRDWKVERLGKPGKITDPTHPLHGFAFVAAAPPGLDVSQAEARILLPPPPCWIWRANTRGAWCVRLGQHRVFSVPWARHSGDAKAACMAALRQAWRLWLNDNMLEESACPIAGIF